jgi:hypothetical protein
MTLGGQAAKVAAERAAIEKRANKLAIFQDTAPLAMALNPRHIGSSFGLARSLVQQARFAEMELRARLETNPGYPDLGSGLIEFQSQKMTVAASAMAERKTLGHRS